MTGSGLAPGVHTVLVTPFRADQSLDEGSMGPLVELVVSAGVQGVLALGFLGEAHKLSDGERRRVLELALLHVDGRVEVTAGVSQPSTFGAAAAARAAERLGVTAVMVAPPAGTSAGPELREHFLRVADGLSVPVVVQDYPASGGVRMPVEFLVSLVAELPPGSAVKLEEPPTAAKIARLRAAAPALPVIGGLGGAAVLHELAAGSAGTMTGFAYPELLVEIVEAHRAGDTERARRVFEGQEGLGLGVRKEILRRRGAIADATVRAPAPALDEQTLSGLDALLETRRQADRLGVPTG